MSSRIEKVSTPDGPFDLTVWLPEAGYGPGILLIQEIFGVGDYISRRRRRPRRARLRRRGTGPVLAAQAGTPGGPRRERPGRVAGARVAIRRRPGRGRRRRRLERLAALPEVRGGLGVIGFCLGGSIGYFLAARAPVDAVVSFYGSDVPGPPRCWRRSALRSSSTSAGTTRTSRVIRWAGRGSRPGQRQRGIHVEEDAGHAFHNRKAPMFHHPEPAARAWQRTEEFLARHLPVHKKAPQP